MSRNDLKNWEGIIKSIKGPLPFFALVILCFQMIILALIYKGNQENINTLVLLSSIVISLPIVAVSLAFIRSSKLHSTNLSREVIAPTHSNKAKIFITSPMSTYKTNQEYCDVRQGIIEIVTVLRNCDFIEDVFFFNERFESLESFENADLSVPEYFHNIDECDYFVLIVSDRQFSSIHFESGFALAKHKKSIYFVSHSNCLPFLTRLAVFAYPDLIRSYEFSSFKEIGKMLTKKEMYI